MAGHDDRTLPLVTCGQTDGTAYLLEPVFLPGSEVSDATSVYSVISVVSIRIAILGGMAQISGKFTKQRAQDLARRIQGS